MRRPFAPVKPFSSYPNLSALLTIEKKVFFSGFTDPTLSFFLLVMRRLVLQTFDVFRSLSSWFFPRYLGFFQR